MHPKSCTLIYTGRGLKLIQSIHYINSIPSTLYHETRVPNPRPSFCRRRHRRTPPGRSISAGGSALLDARPVPLTAVFVIVLESAVDLSDPAACRRVVKLQQIEDLIAVPPVAPLLHAAGWALPSAQPSWWRLHSSPPMQRATVVVAAPLVVVEEAWTGPLRRWPSLRPIRVAPPSLRLIRATPSSAHGPAPCRLPDRLLLLFSFSRSVIGFASPSPTAVDSRIIDIGFDNTDFLISFDCVAGVACGVTGTPACAAPPRLHVDLRRLVFATTDREAPPSTSPSPSLSSPRTPSA